MRLYAELKKPPAESSDLTAWSIYTQLLEKSFQRETKEPQLNVLSKYIKGTNMVILCF